MFPPHVFSTWRQALGSVYGGLQLLAERSAMVTRALEYVGDILKYVKPYVVNKNQEGMQLAYWAVGTYSQHDGDTSTEY